MNNSSNTNREQQLVTWSQIISDCQSARASGIKVRDWLKANNISKDTYYYWYREVKDSYISSSLPEIIQVPEVLIPSTSSIPGSCTDDNNSSSASRSVQSSSIKLSINGINIEVNELSNPELLASVIKVVRYA